MIEILGLPCLNCIYVPRVALSRLAEGNRRRRLGLDKAGLRGATLFSRQGNLILDIFIFLSYNCLKDVWEVFVMSDIKRIGLRMPMNVYLKLERVSKDFGVPVANLINFIVAQWIDNQLYVRDRLISELKDVLVELAKGSDFGEVR